VNNLDDILAINARFRQTWDQSIPYMLDNEPTIEEPGVLYAHLQVDPGNRDRLSISKRSYKQIGRIILDVYVPAGDAVEDGWALIEQFSAAFTDWHTDDYRLRCDPPEYRTDDVEDDWFIITASVPYTAEH
jgi:hypothetical protein